MSSPTTQVFAVPDEGTAGCITYWRLSGTTDPDRLAAHWEKAGLDLDDLPSLPTPSTALSRAVRGLQRGRTLIRPLADRGCYSVVVEAVAGDVLSYAQTLTVRLDDVGRAVFAPEDHPLAATIRAAYVSALNEHDTADVASWLVWVLARRCDAVSLRDHGGVYYVPPTKSAAWDAIVGAVRASTGHRVFKVPALSSRDVLDAVLDAVEREAAEEAAAMAAEVQKASDASKGMTEKVGRSRLSRCDEVEARVSRYEELLGTRLDAIRERLEELRVSLTTAMLNNATADAEAAAAEE